MARKKTKARSYWEPWLALASTGLGPRPCADGVPEHMPPEVSEGLCETWDRLDKNRNWIVWGTDMGAPTVCKNLMTNEFKVMDGQRIVCHVNKLAVPEGGLIGGGVSQEQLATRIAECVTAMAGIADRCHS
jgi:hypothetical protein